MLRSSRENILNTNILRCGNNGMKVLNLNDNLLSSMRVIDDKIEIFEKDNENALKQGRDLENKQDIISINTLTEVHKKCVDNKQNDLIDSNNNITKTKVNKPSMLMCSMCNNIINNNK